MSLSLTPSLSLSLSPSFYRIDYIIIECPHSILNSNSINLIDIKNGITEIKIIIVNIEIKITLIEINVAYLITKLPSMMHTDKDKDNANDTDNDILPNASGYLLIDGVDVSGLDRIPCFALAGQDSDLFRGESHYY